jgi:hypothetical protein
MDTLEKVGLLQIYIPSIGTCTLVPLYEEMDQELHRYKALWEIAKLAGLSELPGPSRKQREEIFKVLVGTFSLLEIAEGKEIRVLISGTHDAYPYIDDDCEGIQLTRCVTAISICHWIGNRGLTRGYKPYRRFERLLDETSVEEPQKMEPGSYLFCLFFGGEAVSTS